MPSRQSPILTPHRSDDHRPLPYGPRACRPVTHFRLHSGLQAASAVQTRGHDCPVADTRCAGCQRELPESHDLPERKPCPDCGSLAREHSVAMSATVHASASVSVEVERGLNDIRLAVLGILVGIALTVGFGVPGSVWVQVLAGLGAFATGCVLIRWRWSLRHHSSAPHVGS